MKIEKKLKEVRKKIDEQILSEQQDLYNELVEKYCINKTISKTTTNKNSIRWIATVSCVVVVCLVISISIILTRPSIPEYFYQNEIQVNSSIEEFNYDTNSSICFGNDYRIVSITRKDDAISSDKLYYHNKFEHTEEFISGELFIVTNKYYSFAERHVGEVQISKFGPYDMEYSVREVVIEDIPMNEYFGCIVYNDYRIYFSFEELHEDDVLSPQLVLSELLIVK